MERYLTLNKKRKSCSSKPFDKFETLTEVMLRIQIWNSEMESTLSQLASDSQRFDLNNRGALHLPWIGNPRRLLRTTLPASRHHMLDDLNS